MTRAGISADDQGGRKSIFVRNPWGEYGRAYEPDPKDGRLRAVAQTGPVSQLPLQEITKRFQCFEIAEASLA